MSEIPEDIHKAAEAAFEEVLSKAYKEYGFSSQYRLVGQTAREIIARAILAERERHGWQPIDTAPKDWTNLILFDDERDPPVFEGYYSMADGGQDCWMEDRGMGSEYVNPTHWKAFPSPPKP